MTLQEWLTLAIVALQYLANHASLKKHQEAIVRLTAQNNAMTRSAATDGASHGAVDDASNPHD